MISRARMDFSCNQGPFLSSWFSEQTSQRRIVINSCPLIWFLLGMKHTPMKKHVDSISFSILMNFGGGGGVNVEKSWEGGREAGRQCACSERVTAKANWHSSPTGKLEFLHSDGKQASEQDCSSHAGNKAWFRIPVSHPPTNQLMNWTALECKEILAINQPTWYIWMQTPTEFLLLHALWLY